jgi:hypothetical protein
LKITPLRPDQRVEAKQTFYTATRINVQPPLSAILRAIDALRPGERLFGMRISRPLEKRGHISLKLAHITVKVVHIRVKVVYIRVKLAL